MTKRGTQNKRNKCLRGQLWLFNKQGKWKSTFCYDAKNHLKLTNKAQDSWLFLIFFSRLALKELHVGLTRRKKNQSKMQRDVSI
jgi:hypothetical protein